MLLMIIFFFLNYNFVKKKKDNYKNNNANEYRHPLECDITYTNNIVKVMHNIKYYGLTKLL